MPNQIERKCAECGYLAIRTGGEFAEVSEDVRDSFPYATAKPCCFVRQQQMVEEVRLVETNEHGKFDMWRFTNIINRDRVCDAFREWDQGFSPKEHVEMGMMERQEKREDSRDRRARRHSITELIIIGVIVPAAMIAAQVVTTRMQVEATMKAAMAQYSAAPQPINNIIQPAPVASPPTPARQSPHARYIPSDDDPIEPQVTPE